MSITIIRVVINRWKYLISELGVLVYCNRTIRSSAVLCVVALRQIHLRCCAVMCCISALIQLTPSRSNLILSAPVAEVDDYFIRPHG